MPLYDYTSLPANIANTAFPISDGVGQTIYRLPLRRCVALHCIHCAGIYIYSVPCRELMRRCGILTLTPNERGRMIYIIYMEIGLLLRSMQGTITVYS